MNAVRSIVALALTIAAAPHALALPPSVGAPPTSATTSINNVSLGTIAAAALAAASTANVVTNRPPSQSDDGSIGAGFVKGSTWLYNTRFWRLDDPTVGFPGWTDITSRVLPLDVAGERVGTVSIAGAGSGFVAGDVGKTITLAASTVLTISSVNATSPGTLTGVLITDPHWMACAPAGAQAAASSTATGTGATFNLTMLPFMATATRLLTKCYSGAEKTIVRGDTMATFAVPFMPDGAADDAAEDRFTAGNPTFTKVLTWNDQSGNGFNATQTYGNAPVSFPGRRLFNARSVMFSAHGLQTGGDPAGDPGWTDLNIPAALTVARNNMTMISVAAAQTVGYMPVTPLNVGSAFAGPNNGVGGAYTTNAGIYCGNTLDSGTNIRDDGSVLIGTCAAGSTTITVDNTTIAAAYAPSSATISGGTIGQNLATGTGLQDHDADIVLGWTLTPTEQAALQASLDQTFAISPQGQKVFIALGHSLVDGTGALNQQGWVRKADEALGRPDWHFYNFSAYADTLSHQLSLWSTRILPTASKFAGQKIFFMLGGDNDVAADGSMTQAQAIAQVIGYYQQFNTLAHAAGGTSICGLGAYKGTSTSLGPFPSPQTGQLGMKSVEDGVIALGVGKGGSTCDYIYDERLQLVFGDIADIAATPTANYAPLVASGLYISDDTHKTVLGQAVERSMFLPILKNAIQ